MPESFLPQSALPVGQTPLQVIRPPQVNINIPNPLDVTNFFRMQQGLNTNLGLLQQNEQLKLQRRELDLREYESSLREMDQILGMINGLQGQAYASHSANKQARSASGPIFSDLDPRNTRHAEVMRRMQGEQDAAIAQAYQIAQSNYVGGKRDPAMRLEASRQLTKLTTDLRNKMAGDPEYMELATNQRDYDAWQDALQNAAENGYDIDAEARDRLEAKYQKYANEGYDVDASGNAVPIKLKASDFDPSKFMYKSSTALTGITTDIKALAEGTDKYEEITASDGSKIAAVRTIKRTAEDMTPIVAEKWANDKNAQALYNNTVKGKVHPAGHPKAGQPITFEDWISTFVKQYAPQKGMENIISNVGTVISRPNQQETKTTTVPERFDKGTEEGRRLNDFNEMISSEGYDPYSVPDYKLRQIDKNPEKFVEEIDKDGNKVYYEGAFNADGDPIMENIDKNGNVVKKKADESDKAWKRRQATIVGKRQVKKSTTPYATFKKASVKGPATVGDAVQWPKDADLGARNNNPGNLRPTSRQRKNGIPIGEGGFIKFNTPEEGAAAHIADLKVKVRGDSTAMTTAPYMVAKYDPQELSEYEEYATIEDFLNVHTPRKSYGGDNTDAEVDNYLDHLEKAGFPRNMKLEDLSDEQIIELHKAMVQIESPDSYKYLYEKDIPLDPPPGAPVKPGKGYLPDYLDTSAKDRENLLRDSGIKLPEMGINALD